MDNLLRNERPLDFLNPEPQCLFESRPQHPRYAEIYRQRAEGQQRCNSFRCPENQCGSDCCENQQGRNAECYYYSLESNTLCCHDINLLSHTVT